MGNGAHPLVELAFPNYCVAEPLRILSNASRSPRPYFLPHWSFVVPSTGRRGPSATLKIGLESLLMMSRDRKKMFWRQKV